MSGLMLSRDSSSISKRLFEAHSEFGGLGRPTGQSSLTLFKLLRIAKTLFGINVARPRHATLTSLALGQQQPIRRMTTHTHPLLQEPCSANRSKLPLDSSYSPPNRRPSRIALPSRQWLTPSRFKLPTLPGGRTSTKEPHVRWPAMQRFVASAPVKPTSSRPPVAHSVTIETIGQAPASRPTDVDPTFRGSRSPSVRSFSMGRQRAATIAPFAYYKVGREVAAAASRTTEEFGKSIAAVIPWRTSTWSSPTTAEVAPARSQTSSDKANATGQGDLYLEGSVFGQWLIQHLNREIVRPRSGIIAVDPRATPSWGGPSLLT